MTTDFITQTKAAIAQLTSQEIDSSTVDISTCDREAIHVPGQIQPHGVMLVLEEAGDAGWQIIQVSENTTTFLDQPPEAFLDQPLTYLLNPEQIQTVEDTLNGDFEAVNPLHLEIAIADELGHFIGIVHRAEDVVILELEPTSLLKGINFFNFHNMVKRPIGCFQQTTSLGELSQVAVKEIKRITGYDRVMMYTFDEDGSGSVVAEAKQPEMEAYTGLRYPATDIPEQAKYLYLLNLLRIIPDVNYDPVSLVGSPRLTAGDEPPAPVDMSLASLRSVSKLHTEYLSNMGVSATLAISIVRNNRLWGLLVCHHNSPRYLSYEMRTVCEFLGQVIALELNAKIENEDADYKLQLKSIQARLLKTLPQSSSIRQGLTQDIDSLLALTGATGAAIFEQEDLTLVGQTPEAFEIQGMMAWLKTQFTQSTIYQTAALSSVYEPATRFQCKVGGLLALAISRGQGIYVLWFRPEVQQTVNWAGNPEKSVKIDSDRTHDGEIKLSPRKSFALWQQTVEGQSLPWKPWEVEAAMELRSAVIGLVLQKADELAELNSELTRSNIELDSFAYIASHDLKEPLRGIHNYSSFLIEDYGDTLGDDGVDKLNTLIRLTQRMEDLISSLLHYSRLGRAELELEPVPLSEVVTDILEMIGVSQPVSLPQQVSFEGAASLPVVKCDRTQVTELYTNLITNAIKYNDKAHKRIEIGTLSVHEAIEQGIRLSDTGLKPDKPPADSLKASPFCDATIFYVRDNGIGIREKHLESVFRIFKRLHGPKHFGGGTGAGLTIAKKIVERHHGRLWVDSVYGEGSTFYFTLEALTNHE